MASLLEEREPTAGIVVEDLFSELTTATPEPPLKRDRCKRCRRPVQVCLCRCFPKEPVPISTRLIILQHPSEESRCLATVPLLQQCLPAEQVHVLRGKRFRLDSKFSVLRDALLSPDSLVLFPGHDAVDITTLPPTPVGSDGSKAAVIVLDGTWAQARSLFTQNQCLHNIRKVKLSNETISEYVIRTQPTRHCMSTLESVAHALAWLEQMPDIVETLVYPLRALCQYQLEHGAVVHSSKDTATNDKDTGDSRVVKYLKKSEPPSDLNC